jgi:Kdo2-lipid IVA lauroyltransferase/acyltransferase
MSTGAAPRPKTSGARRHAVEAAAAGAVSGLAAMLPRRVALALGRGLGRAWGRVDRRHLSIAEDNLARAFPDWDDARRRAVALGVYGHFGRVLLDVLWLARREPEEILRHVDVIGAEHVEAARAAGRGALLVTAHIGNWEAHGIAHGLLFGAIGLVARPLDNPALDARLCDFRRRPGNTVIYKKKALPQVLRLLRDNRAVAFLIDQNVQAGDGVFVDFFGRKAATTTVAAALALKTGCAVIPTHAALGEDGRYRLVYEPPIAPAPAADRAAELQGLTQRLTSVIEGWVRERPEQWLWLHRRWKTQPAAVRP